MAYALESTSSIADTFTAVTQELLVIVVFFVSLLLFKYIGQRHNAGKQKWKTPSSPPCSPVTPAKKPLKRAEVSGGNFDGNAQKAAQEAETQMTKLLEQREFTRALSLFRKFERDGSERYFSEALFASFIQSAIRVGKIDVVERLLRSMKNRGAVPSNDFWKTTLKVLSSRKHFDVCLSIHASYGRSLPADKVIYSCLINAALESGAPERASAMIGAYQEADLEPKDHVLIFRTYVAMNDVESAAKVFEALGEHITTLMLNLLLLTCVNAKQPERALEFLHKARDFQESQGGRSCNTVIKENQDEPLFTNSSDDNGIIVDVVSYNTTIKGFAQARMLPRCFDCLHEMRSNNVEPDDVTFVTLLDVCINDCDMGAANEVVNLMVNGDKPVDTVMCTLFIKGLVRAQQLPKAFELYEEMKRKNVGAQPDIVTYSVLIKAFVDAHDLEKALLLVEDLMEAGHTPDDIILTHLLEGCRFVGNHALGKRLFEDMIAAGVKPSDFTLIAMVKLHGKCGAHDDAYNLVASWEKTHAMKPTVIHYTCLMSGCLRTKNYDQAWAAYKLMTEMNVNPDETTMATLLQGMVAARQWDRMLSLVRRSLKGTPPISIPPEILNSALTQVRCQGGQPALADQLEIMMRGANVRLNARNLKGLS